MKFPGVEQFLVRYRETRLARLVSIRSVCTFRHTPMPRCRF